MFLFKASCYDNNTSEETYAVEGTAETWLEAISVATKLLAVREAVGLSDEINIEIFRRQ